MRLTFNQNIALFTSVYNEVQLIIVSNSKCTGFTHFRHTALFNVIGNDIYAKTSIQ
jgi:hypothetical protein